MVPTYFNPKSQTFRLAAASALITAMMCMACNTSPQAREAAFLRKGAALLQKKDYSRALLEFRNASSAMPKDAEPVYQMAITYLTMGNSNEAVRALRKATELNPRHEQAQLKLAELMTMARDKGVVQQAASRLEALLADSPNNSEANDALALADWKLGKKDEAQKRLEDTLQKFPSRLQTSVELARVKLSRNDLPGAEQVLKQAVASAPGSAQAELALGQLYALTNDLPKAETELRKAIQIDPKNGNALVGLAAIQVAGKRLDEAEETYRRVAALPGPEFKPLHALFLYKNGKRDAAMAELEKLAREDPSDRAARTRLVAVYQAMGKNQAAQDLLGAALKKNSQDIDALFQRAGLLLQSGKTTEAAADLRQVLHFKPDFAGAHLAMADVHKTENQKMSERQELTEALRLDPSLLQARLRLARSLTRAGDAKPALEILGAAPASQKTMLAFVIERNWALLAAGEYQELRSALDQALRVRHFQELLIQDALLRLQQGDSAGARSPAEEAVQNAPEDARPLKLLADVYVAQKQPAKAEDRIKAAVAAHPKSAPLAYLLGEWYLNSKNSLAARKAFESSVAADPKFLAGSLVLAQLDYRENRLDAARQELRGTLAVDPKNVPALLMMGTIAGDMHNKEEAIQQYRAILAIDSSNVMALNNLAYTLAVSDPDEALKYAQQAEGLAPDNATVQDTIGWIYYRKAIYSTAVHYLETAVAKESTPRRQFHLAMSYVKSGNRDLGEKMLQQALQRAPNLIKTEEGW